MKKKIIALLLTLTLIYSPMHAWRGHWGGYHRGYRGYGWGYRRPWRGGWGWGVGVPLATGIAIAASSDSRSDRDEDYTDDMGRSYWTVENNTSLPIRVKTPGYGYKLIKPGTKRTIQRGYSFQLKIEQADGKKLQFLSQDHFVRINQTLGGSMNFETWNRK